MAQNAEQSRRTPALLFGAYVEFAKVGLSNVFLINAGSASALIAFLGSSRKTSPPDGCIADSFVSNGGAAWAVKWFAFGALIAILGTALLALQENQNSARLEDDEHLVAYLGVPATILLVVSGVAFVVGCFGAVR